MLNIIVFLFGLLESSAVYSQAPAPSGLTPNGRQIEWFHREQQAFIHFNMNTFTGAEWGTGGEDPKTFNPTALDCNQWCSVFKKTGITTAILTVKHHDGFCLWPSQYTDHCVKNSSWKGGKGDVLREFTDACKAAGIKAAIYLSPWDMNYPSGTREYIDYYWKQIVELCKGEPYDSLWEIWQDGAGEIDAITEADYKKWADTLHEYMPECVVWTTKRSYKNGDVRWVGNEGGTAGDPCWATINGADVLNENNSVMSSGSVNGDSYLPAETNVSIRPGWFYHSNEHPKPVQQLWDMYFTSTARNTVWLLNFTPDTRGMIPAEDSTNAAGLGKWIYGTFRTNLLAGATATALHGRGTGFEPGNMLDNCEDTYFASADGNKTDTITFQASSPITFDCIMMQEVIELGHRTLNWTVEYSGNGSSWTSIAAANNKQCIGYKRAVKWSTAITATHVRLCITSGRACPAIHTFGVFKQNQADPPGDWDGLGPVKKSCITGILPVYKSANMIRNGLHIAGTRIVLSADFGVGPVTMAILDMQGHCLQTMVTQGTGFERSIALPPLKSGLYLVRCSSGRLTLDRKIFTVR